MASFDLNPTVGFEVCDERIIIVKYGHRQTTGFKERHGQNLVKFGYIRSNLIDGPEATRLFEILI